MSRGPVSRPAVDLLLLVLAFVAAMALLVVPAKADSSPEPAIGLTETFKAIDWSTGSMQPIHLAATVQYVGEHCVLYVEKGYPVPAQFLAGLGAAFDTVVFPTLTSVLGSAPDPGIDGQARIVIVLYDFRDPRFQVMGFFDRQDMNPFGPSDPDSNRREMFSLNLPPLLVDPKRAESTSAHEFAHLLLFYRDFLLDPSPRREYEDRWVEEGIAVYAEFTAGYADRTDDTLRSFETTPTKNLTSWTDLNYDYGASFAFVAYLADRYGVGLLRDLVDQPLDGIAGIDATLEARGVFDDFDSLFKEWVIANFLDGRPPLAPPWSYGTLTVAVEPQSAGWPLPLVGAELALNYGAVYLDAQATDTTTAVRAVIDGEDGSPLHADLVSWDSVGLLAPAVTHIRLSASTAGGAETGPPGYDRHTLVVWAQGAESERRTYAFRYSLASDRPDGVQFLDVGSDHDFYPYISVLVDRGVVSGREVPPASGLWYFSPGENVMRAQFAKMVVEAVGLHTDAVESLTEPTFADVVPVYDQLGAPVPYPFDYVEEAAAAGIVRGYGDERFRPWDPLKRIQLVSMILRAAAAAGHPFPAYQGSEAVFADVPPGSPSYADAMTGYKNGIFSGSLDENGVRRLRPADPALRGHVAKMTANLLGSLETSGS